MQAKADKYIDIHDTERSQQMLESLYHKYALKKAPSLLQKTVHIFLKNDTNRSQVLSLSRLDALCDSSGLSA